MLDSRSYRKPQCKSEQEPFECTVLSAYDYSYDFPNGNPYRRALHVAVENPIFPTDLFSK
jgi:hypothetical protein